MHLLAQATQPSQIATDVIAILAAFGTLVATVLGAWALYKAGSAKSATDVNTQRIGNVAKHINDVDGRQTDLAKEVGRQAGITDTMSRPAFTPTDKPKG